jgi:menaquinone-dependent protoporphyrinogen oxidase
LPQRDPRDVRMMRRAGGALLEDMSHHATSSVEHGSPDADALVVYASTHGHTAKIAARLAEAMRGQGLAVDLRGVADAGDAAPDRYDLVVVGGSLHKEHHQQELVEWVTARHDALAAVASVFLSVSLSAADPGDDARAATQRCIEEFCAQTGWTPERTERIAGALQYREYDPFTRQLMRLLMKRMGHPTDASHDYDYTDWDAVDRLGRELAAGRTGATTVAGSRA